MTPRPRLNRNPNPKPAPESPTQEKLLAFVKWLDRNGTYGKFPKAAPRYPYPKRTRADVVAFLKGMDDTIPIPDQAQCKRDAKQKLKWHFGLCELRQLMDYLYDGPPTADAEQLSRSIFVKEESS